MDKPFAATCTEINVQNTSGKWKKVGYQAVELTDMNQNRDPNFSTVKVLSTLILADGKFNFCLTIIFMWNIISSLASHLPSIETTQAQMAGVREQTYGRTMQWFPELWSNC